MKNKNNDNTKGLLVLLILLFIVFKDVIMHKLGLSPCKGDNALNDGQNNDNDIYLPDGDSSKPETFSKSPSVSKISLDAETFERQNDESVTSLSQAKYSGVFKAVSDSLEITKNY